MSDVGKAFCGRTVHCRVPTPKGPPSESDILPIGPLSGSMYSPPMRKGDTWALRKLYKCNRYINCTSKTHYPHSAPSTSPRTERDAKTYEGPSAALACSGRRLKLLWASHGPLTVDHDG